MDPACAAAQGDAKSEHRQHPAAGRAPLGTSRSTKGDVATPRCWGRQMHHISSRGVLMPKWPCRAVLVDVPSPPLSVHGGQAVPPAERSRVHRLKATSFGPSRPLSLGTTPVKVTPKVPYVLGLWATRWRQGGWLPRAEAYLRNAPVLVVPGVQIMARAATQGASLLCPSSAYLGVLWL